MKTTVLIYNSIKSPSYSKVRLRHSKYASQLTLPSSSNFLHDIRNITFYKLLRLKKISRINFSRSTKPLLLVKHYRKLVANNSQSLQTIISSSVIINSTFKSLKKMKILKNIYVSPTHSPIPILSLKKINTMLISFDLQAQNVPTSECPLEKIKRTFQRIYHILTHLRKVQYDKPTNELLDQLKSITSRTSTPIQQFLLALKGPSPHLNFSLGSLTQILTMFSVNIPSRKAYTTYFDTILSAVNLQSLSLTIYSESLKTYNTEALSKLSELPILITFHLLTSVPLEEYIYHLKLPKSLRTVILQLRDMPSVESSPDLEPYQKAYQVLINELAGLHNLRILQLEARPAHDGFHMVFHDALENLMEKLPDYIENFGVVEWYFISKDPSRTDSERLILSYDKIMNHLSHAKHLQNLSLYLNIHTPSLNHKGSLENICDLFLTINAEVFKIEEILQRLNPSKLKHLSLLNRSAKPGWIQRESLDNFISNLEEFTLLESLNITGFYLQPLDNETLEMMADTLVELEHLETLNIDISINSATTELHILERMKNIVLAKKLLQYLKLKIAIITDNDTIVENIELVLEKNDVKIEFRSL